MPYIQARVPDFGMNNIIIPPHPPKDAEFLYLQGFLSIWRDQINFGVVCFTDFSSCVPATPAAAAAAPAAAPAAIQFQINNNSHH